MAVSKKESNEKLFIIEKAPGNSKPTINTLSIKKAIIKDNNEQVYYSLQNNRKFDLEHLKTLKAKEYVKKITI